MYKAQGKFFLAVGLAGNAGVQCAEAVNRRLLIDLAGQEGEQKGGSPKKTDRSL